MVVIEEVEEPPEAQFRPPGRGVGSPTCFVVSGAGLEAANGLYTASATVWHGAPMYENTQRCLLSREPHKTKAGDIAYGWIVGLDKQPLYAIQSESLLPPETGWRKFKGAAPAPTLEGFASSGDGAHAAAQAWKDAGNLLFASELYPEAEELWTLALSLPDLRGEDPIQVALHSNRAEARLRLRKWEAALGDAEGALRLKPSHDKALLRGAVAARELGRLQLALDMAAKCADEHPRLPEAQQLLEGLRDLARSQNEEASSHLAAGARRKLRAAASGEVAEADPTAAPRAFDAKDVNSKKGFKAFEGYSKKRVAFDEKPSLDSLPYHHMGLPEEQIQLMDNFFKEMREKKAEKERKEREDATQYDKLRQEYRQKAEEDISSGKIAQLDELLPSEKVRREQEEAARRKAEEAAAEAAAATPEAAEKADGAGLSGSDAAQIDALFRGLPAKELAAGSELAASSGSSNHRERLQKAKQLVRRAEPAAPADGRTSRERELDREEAEERQASVQRSLALLQALRYKRGGEPSRFEQAASEIYCWWSLPPDVSGREVRVSASKGGTWLTVSVRDVAIFDRQLFHAVRGDDLVWTLESGDLHLTMTKADRNKLWEKLGEVPEIRHDEEGRVVPSSIPDALSAAERLAMFRQMLHGDDGAEHNLSDLSQQDQRLVDAMRRYESARARGDDKALYEAEEDLEDFGRMVV